MFFVSNEFPYFVYNDYREVGYYMSTSNFQAIRGRRVIGVAGYVLCNES